MLSILEKTRVHAGDSLFKAGLFIVLGILISLTASGILFGWSSLVLVLQSEGVYHELCSSPGVSNMTTSAFKSPLLSYPLVDSSVDVLDRSTGLENSTLPQVTPSNQTSTCVAQNLRLNLIYTLPVTSFAITSLPFGAFMDWKGARLLFAIGATFFGLGHLVFAFGYKTEVFDGLLLANFLIMYSGGAIYLSLFTFGQILPKYASSIMGAVSIAFDSSTFVWFFYMVIYKHTRLSPRIWFLGYIILPVLYLIFALFWPTGVGEPKSKSTEDHKLETIQHKEENNDYQLEILESPDKSKQKDNNRSEEPVKTASDDKLVSLDLDNIQISQPEQSLDFDHEYPVGSKNLHDANFWDQLKSKEFVFLTIFHTMFMFWLNGYLGSAQTRLDYVNTDGNYTQKIVSLIEMLGLIVSMAFCVLPVFAVVSHKGGSIGSLLLVCITGSLWSIFQMIVSRSFPLTSLNIQIVTFTMFSLSRAFYFSMLPSLVAFLFGWPNLGKLYGTMNMIAGPFGLLFYPMLSIVLNWLGGNFFIPNLIQLMMMLGSFSFTFYIYDRKRRFRARFGNKAFENNLVPQIQTGETTNELLAT